MVTNTCRRSLCRWAFCAAWLLPAMGASLQAQPMPARFYRLATDDGLSQSSALCLVQDHEGFLWIGTQDGLSRYDGHSFTHLRRGPGPRVAMGNDFVRAVVEHPAGTLWIGAQDSLLYRYDLETERIRAYPLVSGGQPDTVRGRRPFRILSIQADGSGLLWVGTDVGLFRFSPETGEATRVTLALDTVAADTLEIETQVIDARGVHWIGATVRKSGKGEGEGELADTLYVLLRLGETGPGPDGVLAPATPVAWAESKIVGLAAGRDERLLVSTSGSGLLVVNDQGGVQIYRHDPADPHTLGSDQVTVAMTDSRGRLWVGTADAGVSRLDEPGTRFVHFRHSPSDRYSLSNNEVHALLEDRNGVVWIGTWDGLNGYAPTHDDLVLYSVGEGGPQFLRDGRILAIQERTPDVVWLGTMGGTLVRLDRRSDQQRSFRISSESSTPPWTNALLFDHEGGLWIGTSRGVYRLPASESVLADPELRLIKDDVDVISFAEDRAGDVWMGTTNKGLFRWQRESGEFLQYPIAGSRNGEGRTWPIVEDPRGTLWVGGVWEGLYQFDRTNDRLVRYASAYDHPDSLRSNEIHALAVDSSGRLWIGTNEGLCALHAESHRFECFTSEDGLAHDHVGSILEDDRHRLWISTNDGLSRFDPATRTFETLRVYAGLQGNRFFVGSALKNRRGELLFGGQGGLTILDPNALAMQGPGKLVLTGIDVNHHPYPVAGSSDAPRGLDLSHHESTVSFTVASLDFSHFGDVRYRYRLEGLDNTWVDNGANPRIAFTNLDSEHYVLHVEASTGTGSGYTTRLSLPIVIRPAFYETWWFILAVLLVTLGPIAGWIIQSFRVERLRTDIAIALHDDIGARLGSIGVRVQMAMGRAHDDGLRRQLEEINRVARGATVTLRNMISIIKSPNQSVSDLTDRIKDTTAQLLDGVLAYRLDVAEGLPNKPISMTYSKHVLHFTQEALQNVTKHARASRVDIRVGLRGNTLSVSITDDGLGFDPATAQRGNGLNNMEAHAAAIHGTFSLKTASGDGTTVAMGARLVEPLSVRFVGAIRDARAVLRGTGGRRSANGR